ncbi:MAG: hypothetical protein G8237_12315 [Magnetococcales bacterium]|nr:hypothetical protein [Magnetococcales bacterium]
MAVLLEKPKRREIFAADFRDRIMHHILVAELAPKWERRFIADSYACRKGKGTHRGVKRLQQFTRQVTENQSRTSRYLQLDVRGFFISINRHFLFERLAARVHDAEILWLLRLFIFYDPVQDCQFRSATKEEFLQLPARKTLFKAEPDCGLPIGNLTSQFFANVYLDALDQFVKHKLKVRHYVRYCDDFVLLSQSREELIGWYFAIHAFLNNRLRLQLNGKSRLQPIGNGIDFLGYIVRPWYLLVRRRVATALHERLSQASAQLVRQGLTTDTNGRKVYPYPWDLLTRIRAWLTSYHGHFHYALGAQPWQNQLARHIWLAEYFQTDQGKPSYRRLSGPRHVQSVFQQRKWFRKLLPDHVLMTPFGSCWEMTCCSAQQTAWSLWCNRRMSGSTLQTISLRLWQSGVPVAWIGETGIPVATIRERVVMKRWEMASPLFLERVS